MIRNLMLAVGLFTLTGASAMAAPAATRTSNHVANAEDPPPADGAKKAKKAKKGKKGDKAPEGDKAPAPAPAK